MKKERLIKILLMEKRLKQKKLLESGVSKGYVSKFVKQLETLNIVSKIGRNEIVVIDIPKLLNYWVSIRKLPKPYYFDVKVPVEKIEKKLKSSNINYSITLFRAAWHRIKLLKVDKIEICVLQKDLKKLFRLLGKPKSYGKVEVYVVDEFDLKNSEKVNGISLVPAIQNYVDLMCIGGNGTRIALELAKKYEFGV